MKILQNRLRFSVGVQYKPSTVMRELVGGPGCRRNTGGAQAECGRDAGGEQVRDATELLVSGACGWWVQTPSSIDLRILVISIIFGANICCVHILLVICAFLHKKNEPLFGRGQFG